MAREKEKRNSQAAEIGRRVRKNRTAVLGLVILILRVGKALFAERRVPEST